MSKSNRKKMYDKLVNNDNLGISPGLSQDDGALKKEFGEPSSDVNFSGMTRKDLMTLCNKSGLDFDKKASKDDLVVLLENKSDNKESVDKELIK